MNEDATKVIDAYLDADSHPVPHAVLVAGPWGCGKTYFLEKLYAPGRMKQARDQRKYQAPFLFVSLYGAASSADVETRIHGAAAPAEAAIGRAAGFVIRSLGEIFRVRDTARDGVDAVARRAKTRLNDYVFVFDDVERIQDNAFNEIMGLINSFVAQHKRRVVLVADDGKLSSPLGEKIVGRRAQIVPDVESVVRNSIAELPKGPTKAFMEDRSVKLVEIVSQSSVDNLRNLAWGLHNARAFVDCLLADSDIPIEHVERTMAVVLAATLWTRSGKIDADVLRSLTNLQTADLMQSIRARNHEEPEHPVVTKGKAFSETFSEWNVEAPPLSYDALIDFERSGVLDRPALIGAIKSQFGFGKNHAEPAWRKLWYSAERPIDAIETALGQLADELKKLDHTEAGLILHAAGLAISFRDSNDIRLTNGMDVVPFFVAYIDEIANAGRLAPASSEDWPFGFSAYEGLGFSSVDTPEFRAIAEHLQKRQVERRDTDRTHEVEAVLLKVEAGDLESIFTLIRDDRPEFSRYPVLAQLDPDRFANIFTSGPPALSVGGRLLAYRYSQAVPNSPLLDEIPWARKVFAAMVAKLEEWPDPHRSRAKNRLLGILAHYEGNRDPDTRILQPNQPVTDESS